MKLFLASEGKNPASLAKLAQFVGGFEGKTIAYIPTAANGTGWDNWKEGGSWAKVQTLGSKINLILLEDYFSADIRPQLAGADIIWFAGGSVSYLMYWLIRSRLNKYLPELLRSGAVYVGSSAGSMVTAATLEVARWYFGEEEAEAEYLPGLGLVDFDIFPHYQDELFDQIKSRYQGEKLYLLKDGNAIIVDGQTVTTFSGAGMPIPEITPDNK